MGTIKSLCRGLLIFAMGFIVVGTSYGAGEPVTWMRTSVATNGDRLRMDNSLSFHTGGTVPTVTITVTPATRYQTMMGFGGSFTESAALAMNLLSAANREIAISAYFGPTGANYSICRAQMGASDFSASLYSYDDVANDFSLANFSIARDVPTIIRYIKDAMVKNPNLKVFGSPWSAPAWMKTNNNMCQGGNLKSDANTQNAWALYFVKYVQAYAAQGVPIWGITIQNEPAAVQSWPSMIFTAAQQRDFLKNYLGPTLAANGLGPANLTVQFLDHNRDMMVSWASTFYNDAVASAMVWGIAIHWYDYGGAGAYANVATVYNNYRNQGKHILATEQCLTGGTHMGDSAGAEEYARDIYGDCLNGCEGWVDWNLALNDQGGPNVSNNWCSAGIIVNRSTLAMTFNPLYYYMVQFSKYCRPGAVRIGCTAAGTGAPQVMAFQNPDNSIAVIAYTQGAAYNARIVWGTQQIEYSATRRSMDDFVWTPTTSVDGNVPASSLKQQQSASGHIVGLDKKQNTPSAAKYMLTGKKVSKDGKSASAASAQSHVAPGVYVDKPSSKDADKK